MKEDKRRNVVSIQARIDVSLTGMKYLTLLILFISNFLLDKYVLVALTGIHIKAYTPSFIHTHTHTYMYVCLLICVHIWSTYIHTYA